MRLSGLYDLLDQKTRHAAAARKALEAANAPGDVHEATKVAEQTAKEAISIAHHIVDDEGIIHDIERVIARMQAATDITSAHRSLAFRDLENASMRLRRELGDDVVVGQ